MAHIVVKTLPVATIVATITLVSFDTFAVRDAALWEPRGPAACPIVAEAGRVRADTLLARLSLKREATAR